MCESHVRGCHIEVCIAVSAQRTAGGRQSLRDVLVLRHVDRVVETDETESRRLAEDGGREQDEGGDHGGIETSVRAPHCAMVPVHPPAPAPRPLSSR